jgi:hypothetical protein
MIWPPTTGADLSSKREGCERPTDRLEIYEKMRKELSFENADGKAISGRFEVRNGTVTVTTCDGRTFAAEIKDS